jgi:KDO2-lipid IV(A) lauroyltransferase
MTTPSRILNFILYGGLQFAAIVFPRPVLLFKGRVWGFFLYFLDKKHRTLAHQNIAIAFPDKSLSFRRKIARKSFIQFGEVIFDLLKISHFSNKKISRLLAIEGEQYLEKALKEKKGVLLFSAHYGNWEIASFLLSRISKLHVVARPLDSFFWEKKILNLRKKLGASVIYKHEAARKVMKALHNQETVAILIDQNVLRSQAIFVNFFGKQAATTPSLATFHLRTLAPIVPVFCYPEKDHTYRVQIMPPVQVASGEKNDQSVLKITQICSKIIENQIRSRPQFWFWVHNRWKTRPKK